MYRVVFTVNVKGPRSTVYGLRETIAKDLGPYMKEKLKAHGLTVGDGVARIEEKKIHGKLNGYQLANGCFKTICGHVAEKAFVSEDPNEWTCKTCKSNKQHLDRKRPLPTTVPDGPGCSVHGVDADCKCEPITNIEGP